MARIPPHSCGGGIATPLIDKMCDTEIVKRLYQSEGMKAAFPDPKERLEHIFEKQVYGLAPSEIIYRIATNYILGFSKEHNGKQYNFRMCDALPYAKDGTLSEKLDELFG